MSNAMSGLYVIGVAGPIGAGKSHFSKMLGYLTNAPIYDCDKRAKNLYYQNALRTRFFSSFHFDPIAPNGKIDKKRIRNLLLSPENKKDVEQIIHLALEADFFEWKRDQEYISPICFVESAILFTSGFYRFCDYTIGVMAPRELRQKRVLSRNNNLTLEEFYSIETLQEEERQLIKEKAQTLFLNDDSSLLIPQAEKLLKQLKLIR